jgi:ABC-type uncharacterized transport system permease subunit
MADAEMVIQNVMRQNERKKLYLNKDAVLQIGRTAAVIASAILIFGAFLLVQGIDPITIYAGMISSTLTSSYGISEVILKSTPFIFIAVATSISTKAGLVNVGGEGQLIIGALFATWGAIFWLGKMPAPFGIIIMMLLGMAGGIIWALIAAVLKRKANMNETITTILLNYISYNVVSIAVYGKLKDPAAFSWPMSAQIAGRLNLPAISGKVNIGIILALATAALAWWILNHTETGFRMKVVSGNMCAAKNAGFNVKRIQFTAMLISGAIAGLAGMVEISGVEGRLRTTTGHNYGYLGFLAAWMAWNNPALAVLTALLIGFLAVSGNVLEFSSGLPSSATQILMAIVLLGILWKGKGGKKHAD